VNLTAARVPVFSLETSQSTAPAGISGSESFMAAATAAAVCCLVIAVFIGASGGENEEACKRLGKGGKNSL